MRRIGGIGGIGEIGQHQPSGDPHWISPHRGLFMPNLFTCRQSLPSPVIYLQNGTESGEHKADHRTHEIAQRRSRSAMLIDPLMSC